jgi:hypothetical protein
MNRIAPLEWDSTQNPTNRVASVHLCGGYSTKSSTPTQIVVGPSGLRYAPQSGNRHRHEWPVPEFPKETGIPELAVNLDRSRQPPRNVQAHATGKPSLGRANARHSTQTDSPAERYRSRKPERKRRSPKVPT